MYLPLVVTLCYMVSCYILDYTDDTQHNCQVHQISYNSHYLISSSISLVIVF
uniref:Uncharacterized protein n=1 Tax=uncultured marine virus TaxID=186617 RepID=A0A0F7L5E1_9VIRU|nr:hypothetical protein [uncultured marine virus]